MSPRAPFPEHPVKRLLGELMVGFQGRAQEAARLLTALDLWTCLPLLNHSLLVRKVRRLELGGYAWETLWQSGAWLGATDPAPP